MAGWDKFPRAMFAMAGIGLCPLEAQEGAGAGSVREDLFISGEHGYHTYRSPAVAVAGDAVLVFCEGRKSSAADRGDIDLLMRRSGDGGASWSEPMIVYEEGGDQAVAIASPCVLVDPEAGLVHLFFCRDSAAAFQIVSSDGGLSWSAPREITRAFRTFGYVFKAIGTGPGHGIVTRGGRLVVPVHVHNRQLAHEIGRIDNNVYRAGVLVSDDRGRSWRAGGLVRANLARCLEPSVAELADGRLLLNMRAEALGARALAWSDDFGERWSPAMKAEGLACPSCQGSMMSLPRAGSDGGLLLFANPAVASTAGYDPASRRRMTLHGSLDGGRTWSRTMLVHEAAAGYSDLAALPDGRVICVFENGRVNFHSRISAVRVRPDFLSRGTER